MTDGHRNELRRLLLFAVAVLVLSFVWNVYAPALTAGFVWDDHTLMEGEAGFRHATFAELMTRPFWPDSPLSDVQAPYYRPVVLLSYRLDIALGGSPRECHFTNLGLHLATCLLLGIVAVRAGASYPGATIASLVWGSLPRLTEAVAWVSGRTDVLAAFFGFAALALWPEAGPNPGRAPWPRSLLAGVLLFLSFASKEVGLAFGAALLVVVAMRGRGREDLLRVGASLGTPVVAYFALRAAALARVESAPPRPLGLGVRVATVLEAVGRYAEATVDPFHSRTSLGMIGEPDVARAGLGAVVLVGAALGAVYLVRRGAFGPRVGFALAGAALLPVIQIVPIALRSAVIADRLLYVPLAGVALGLAVALSHRGPRMRLVGAAAIAAALVLGLATKARAADYRDETTFWVVAAENAHPHNTAPRLALARWLLDSGEPEAACPLFERAIAVLEAEGLAGRPPHRRARESLATCWARIGRYEAALEASRALAAETPERARLALALGFAELHMRSFDRAAQAFARAAVLEDGIAASFVVPPDRLAQIRRDELALDTLTPPERADHLASLGRARDASKAFLPIAVDPALDEEQRYDATCYLLVNGDFADAKRAYDLLPPPPRGWDMTVQFRWRRRLLVHESLVALADRVDALER